MRKDINVQEATKRAVSYLKELFSDTIHNIRLEEVEISESPNEEFWLITLSYTENLVDLGPRKYKVFKITKYGEIKSMKMRETA